MKRLICLILPIIFSACSTVPPTAENSELLLACDSHRFVQKRKKIFVVDEKYKPLIDATFEEFVSTDDVLNGMHVRHKLNCEFPLEFSTNDSRVATVMPDGKLFGGRTFERTYDQYNGTKWVSDEDELFGLIDETGEYLIKPSYKSISTGRYNGAYIYFTSVDDNPIYWDLIGNVLAIQKEKYWRQKAVSCGDTIRFSENGKWGLKDWSDQIVIAARYEALACPHDGVVRAPDFETNMWCPVSKNGIEKDNVENCSEDYYPGIDYWHSTPEKFDDDPFISNVKWVRAYLDYGEGRRERKPESIWDGPTYTPKKR